MIEKITLICPSCGSIHIAYDEQKSWDTRKKHHQCRKCKRSGDDFPSVMITDIRRYREKLNKD